MKPEFDLTKMVEEITMQVEETQEEFIFETIHPYCENVLQMKISKEELKQILLNGAQNPKETVYVNAENLINRIYEERTVNNNIFIEFDRLAEIIRHFGEVNADDE